MVSHWRSASRRAIVAALRSGRAAGLEGEALEKHVAAAYPFGERAMYPYKVWLHEFDRLVRGVDRTMATRRRKGPKLLGEWPGLTDRQREALEG